MSTVRKGGRVFIWLGLASFAWLLLFVWQGLDFTDMGYWLTGYQSQYIQPNNTFVAACWLSNFIAHWMGWFLGGGVLAYKLGYVVVVTTSAMIAYWLLAAQLGRSRMLAVMVLLTVLFTRGYGGNWVGYNELTALFYLVGAALLFFGLVGNRKLLVVLSGVVLGANIFIRFPNILAIALVSAVWLYAWSCRWSLRDVLAWSFWFFGGLLLGVVFVLGLMALLGQTAIYLQGVQAILGLAADQNSHHPGSGLLNMFINDHVRAFAGAASVLVVGGGVTSWIVRQKIFWLSVFVIAAASLLVYLFYIHGHSLWLIPGLCYIVLLSIILIKSRKDPALALLAFVAGMLLLLAPLGSTNGVANAAFGMWLALPFALIWMWQSTDLALSFGLKVKGGGFDLHGNLLFEVRGIRVFVMIVMLALLIQSLALAWRHTYLDSKNRFAMTHSISHPMLAWTFTTAERARVVAELLDAMSHFTKPGDEVFAYNAIPIVHFLTETRPWLGSPWPDMVSAEMLAGQIRQKEQAGASLPCIVRAKGSTYVNSWPIEMRPVAKWWHQDESRRVFEQFEQRHGYVVVWSNDFFEILTATPLDTTDDLGKQGPL